MGIIGANRKWVATVQFRLLPLETVKTSLKNLKCESKFFRLLLLICHCWQVCFDQLFIYSAGVIAVRTLKLYVYQSHTLSVTLQVDYLKRSAD